MTAPSNQPTPDTSGYVDLRPYDVTDQEIFDESLALAKVNLPDWVPREGHTEVLLLEALALQAAETIVALNRLPGAVLETLLGLAGVTKDYGAAPTALAQINAADATGHTVPGGTRLYVSTADGTRVVVMLVEPPGLEIPAGSNSGVVSIIGDVFTAAANGVPAGAPLQMVSPLPWVDSVVLATPIADGRDPESDDEWRDRGVSRLARLSEALVLPRHFEAAALEDPNVARAVAVDNTDPASPTTGQDPGHITVAVLGDGGANLSAEAKEALRAMLDAESLAMLVVHVVDITITTVNMTVQIHLTEASDADAVGESVRQAIVAYLEPLDWTHGLIVRRNEIIALVDQVAGVDWVGQVTIAGANSNGDLVLPTASAVPSAGTITVSIV